MLIINYLNKVILKKTTLINFLKTNIIKSDISIKVILIHLI